MYQNIWTETTLKKYKCVVMLFYRSSLKDAVSPTQIKHYIRSRLSHISDKFMGLTLETSG